MAVTASSQAKAKGSPTTLILTILGLSMLVLGIFFLPGHLATVEITAKPIGQVAGIPITNSYMTSWISLILLSVLFWAGTRSMKLVPSGLQNLVETIIDGLLGLAENVAGKEKGREFFALFATIFLYVLVNNWLELLPGFTNSTVFLAVGGEQVPLFRSPSADLNFTLALAVSAVFMVQFWSIKHTGWGGWASKYVNFKGGGIGFYVGLLELISEMSRIISFSFRLFGNLFAGEVLLSVIPSLIPLVVVLPFLGLEVFVGAVQALVFGLLTLAFVVMATVSHSSEGQHGH